MLDTYSTADTTEADLFSNSSNAWVLFRIVKNGDGTYRIMSTYGGLSRALDAELNHINAGRKDVNTIFYPDKGTTNQKWKLLSVVSDAFSNNGGLANRNVTIELKGSTTKNNSWKPLIEAARDSWNNSGSGTQITLSEKENSSSHTIQVSAFVATWDGLCEKDPDGRNVVATSSRIKINTLLPMLYSVLGTFGQNSSQQKQGVIAHEMGHLFWLGDNPKSNSQSLMKYDDAFNGVYKPQTFDIDNVKFVYD